MVFMICQKTKARINVRNMRNLTDENNFRALKPFKNMAVDFRDTCAPVISSVANRRPARYGRDAFHDVYEWSVKKGHDWFAYGQRYRTTEQINPRSQHQTTAKRIRTSRSVAPPSYGRTNDNSDKSRSQIYAPHVRLIIVSRIRHVVNGDRDRRRITQRRRG